MLPRSVLRFGVTRILHLGPATSYLSVMENRVPPYFAVGEKKNGRWDVSLLCEHEHFDKDGVEKACVLNGLWQGFFDGKTVMVCVPARLLKEDGTYPEHPARIIWRGDFPDSVHPDHYGYQEPMLWLNRRLNRPILGRLGEWWETVKSVLGGKYRLDIRVVKVKDTLEEEEVEDEIPF